MVIFLTGCATGVATPKQGVREQMFQDARKPGVMAQFCTLEATLPGFLGTTTSGQSIFQGYGGQLDEFTAFVISPANTARQVFLANKELYAVGRWSAWVQPDYVSSDRDVLFKLLYGKSVVPEDTGPVTVLARFKVGSYVDFRRETDGITKDNRQSDLEPCPLAPNPSHQ